MPLAEDLVGQAAEAVLVTVGIDIGQALDIILAIPMGFLGAPPAALERCVGAPSETLPVPMPPSGKASALAVAGMVA